MRVFRVQGECIAGAKKPRRRVRAAFDVVAAIMTTFRRNRGWSLFGVHVPISNIRLWKGAMPKAIVYRGNIIRVTDIRGIVARYYYYHFGNNHATLVSEKRRRRHTRTFTAKVLPTPRERNFPLPERGSRGFSTVPRADRGRPRTVRIRARVSTTSATNNDNVLFNNNIIIVFIFPVIIYY